MDAWAERQMSEVSCFQDLIRRVRTGDQRAAAELVRVYEPAIRRAARIRLADSRLRRLFDSIDISQSVFASFFVRAGLGQYELERPEMLLRLLVSMSRKKLADCARRQSAARRDYRRVRAGPQAERQFVAANADPCEQAATQELIQEMRKRLSARELHLAEQRALGRSWTELAPELGETSEALRKQLSRAINRAAHQLGLDQFDDQ
jgi:RNA polymerase sigma-70 factor (ECF subfamily)